MVSLGQQTASTGHCGCLSATTCTEFRQDVGHVDAHGLRADEEQAGYLAVATALGDQLEDLLLARRQLPVAWVCFAATR